MILPCGTVIETKTQGPSALEISIRGGSFARTKRHSDIEWSGRNDQLELVVYRNNLPVLAKYIGQLARRYAPKKRRVRR